MNFLAQLAHLTVPRYSNNHKARLLHPSILLTLAAFVIAGQFAMQFVITSNVKVLGYASNISVDEVIRLINDRREENGLSRLTTDERLMRAAQAKSRDMLEDDYWAHVAPDGTEPWAFFNNEDYVYKYAGENLARDFSNPQSAVDAWMASPSHRNNLLSDKYDETGVAVIEGDLDGADTTIIVQFFGRRLSGAPSVPVASASEKEPVPEVASEEIETQIATPGVLDGGLPPARSTYVNISPLLTTKALSLGLMAVLAIVMVIDVTVVTRKNVTRKSSRVFAHLSFFGMIVAIIIIAKAGQIL